MSALVCPQSLFYFFYFHPCSIPSAFSFMQNSVAGSEITQENMTGGAKYVDKSTIHLISQKSPLIPKEAEILNYKLNFCIFRTFNSALLKGKSEKAVLPQKMVSLPFFLFRFSKII